MAPRVLLVVVVVIAMAAGSFFYFSNLKGGQTDKQVSPAQFDLAGKPGADNAKNEPPAKIDLTGIPDVIAEVNGKQIPKADLIIALEGLKKNLERSGHNIGQARYDQIKNGLIDNIINVETLIAQADKEGIKADPKAIDESLTQVKRNFPNEETFTKALAAQGVTEEEIRRDLGKNIVIHDLLEKNVMNKITINPDDVKKYYDQNQLEFERKEGVHAAHILAQFDAADPASKGKAKKKIESVMQKLQNGADFAKVAKEESDDPVSAAHSGDLGAFGKGEMVPEFEKAAFSTAPGKLSGIVETKFGYHILKVTEKIPAGMIAFDKAKSIIESKLKQEHADSMIKDYLEKLKKELNVKKLI